MAVCPDPSTFASVSDQDWSLDAPIAVCGARLTLRFKTLALGHLLPKLGLRADHAGATRQGRMDFRVDLPQSNDYPRSAVLGDYSAARQTQHSLEIQQ